MIRKNFLRFLGVISTIVVISASPSLAEPIRIGLNMPLTGAFAASGTFVANGARIAADEINANGGLLGNAVELVIEDNKSNPTEAATVAEKLIIRDKVPVLMGSWGSSLTLATMPKLMQYDVPMLVETSGAEKITLAGNTNVFRISAPATIEATAFEKALPKLDIRKVGFLAINNDWGHSTIERFVPMLERNGIEVDHIEYMDQSAQDVTAQLVKARSSDIDALIVTAAVEQLTLVLKQADDMKLGRKIITTGGSQNPDQLVDHAGKAAEGSIHLVFFAPWEADKSADPNMTARFVESWTSSGYDFSGLTESFRGYDGIKVIAAAIEKAGAADPAAIREALWSVEVDTLNGPVRFDKQGPEGRESGQSTPNIYFVKIEDGEVKLLE